MAQALIAITGNTYPVKDQLKGMGGRWNADAKAWMVPADKADAARALLPARTPSTSYGAARPFRGAPQRKRGTWTGCSCGSVEEYTKESDCWTCKHDA